MCIIHIVYVFHGVCVNFLSLFYHLLVKEEAFN